MFFASCDKLFVSISGKEADLQGKWQMDNVDTVYYNFQNSLFQYQIYTQNDAMMAVNGYYTLYGDTAIDLKLILEYSPIQLDFLGWDTIYSSTNQDIIFNRFTIEKFNKEKLILNSNKGKSSFHKF